MEIGICALHVLIYENEWTFTTKVFDSQHFSIRFENHIWCNLLSTFMTLAFFRTVLSLISFSTFHKHSGKSNHHDDTFNTYLVSQFRLISD